jgi:hypothetical protein
MRRLPLAFFTAATLCVLAGMVWGAFMGAKEDFTLAPAHAHLNLVGWASLALMGTFYALTGRSGRLGWINFALSTTAVVVMIPSLVLFLEGDKPAHNAVAFASVLAILGMATFFWNVVAAWRSVPEAETGKASATMKKAA